MYRYLILFILIYCSFFSYSQGLKQQINIDSLKNVNKELNGEVFNFSIDNAHLKDSLKEAKLMIQIVEIKAEIYDIDIDIFLQMIEGNDIEVQALNNKRDKLETEVINKRKNLTGMFKEREFKSPNLEKVKNKYQEILDKQEFTESKVNILKKKLEESQYNERLLTKRAFLQPPKNLIKDLSFGEDPNKSQRVICDFILSLEWKELCKRDSTSVLWVKVLPQAFVIENKKSRKKTVLLNELAISEVKLSSWVKDNTLSNSSHRFSFVPTREYFNIFQPYINNYQYFFALEIWITHDIDMNDSNFKMFEQSKDKNILLDKPIYLVLHANSRKKAYKDIYTITDKVEWLSK